MKSIIYLCLLLMNCFTVAGQLPFDSSDRYRIDYKDVFSNMHYDQALRPQIHYTPLTGQIADPTGLIKYKGKYHLFYMYDEWSRQRRDNKNWGHAISSDCIFWEQQPAITNTIIDNRPGSGSGIVDWNNTLGLRSGIEKTLVVFYTDYKRGISLALSRDAGKTWVRHERNPILPAHDGLRDPNVFWYKPDHSWRMIIYDATGFSFYKSENLLDWHFLSKMEGFFECPDFLQIAVDGNPENKKWVLIDGNGAYVIGQFDGVKFMAETEKTALGEQIILNKSGGHTNYYTPDIYATQTWKQTYEGEGPYYQLAFMMIAGAPSHKRTWSQQMIFPVELTLKTINGQIKLCRNPIDGIKSLRYDSKNWNNITIAENENILSRVTGDVFEIITSIELGKNKEIIFEIRGEKAIYNCLEKQLYFMGSKSPIVPQNNAIKLRFIIDRNSIEIYGNEGEVTFTRLFYPDPDNMKLSLTCPDGTLFVKNLEVYKLESIWLKQEQELGYKRESINNY